MYAIHFDHRSDDGPSLVGPFGSKPAGERWVARQAIEDAEWEIWPIHIPENF